MEGLIFGILRYERVRGWTPGWSLISFLKPSMGRASISTENPVHVNRISYTETIYITRMLQYKMLLKCQNLQKVLK